ncbi:zinc-dependent alcohol dehydrogenase family protein [Paenibacillus sp. N3/727]|uniref:zinc-dependent alcohol dehydrogenase family protein n=1 Tax=Paenibacillus sp. N3/727 TaxID=2925845 RepID=UPI001F53996C|nr:zinc-dependent alcohol dehydrogenase family protein [Paenibacillus sp. N3/727]UNK20274.1 zinc-dependent alcohol dehydrogenase family protein [Paenibacillus sp. N3/727]
MKAAVLRGTLNMEVVDWAERTFGKDEVMMRVACCGICGTDQHIYHGHPGSAEVEPPIVLGHELAGVIEAVGEAVTALQPGDRVSVDPNMYCGSCEYCRSGRAHLCDRLQAIGVTRDGGMGELCVVPAANCYKLPDHVSLMEGAMVEPLGCVLHGYKKLDLRPNQHVLIAGGGFIGQLFLQLVKAAGVTRITVSEPNSHKREALLALGAHAVVSPFDTEEAAGLRDSADVVIECVGRPESVELAVAAARKGGQVLLFGVASPDASASFSPYEIFSKELRIMGSFINPYTHEEAIELIAQGIVRIEPLISHCFHLNDLPDVMATYPQLNVTKAVVVHK